MVEKILTIKVLVDDESATYGLDAKGMHRYEILGILRTATLLQEQDLIKVNDK